MESRTAAEGPCNLARPCGQQMWSLPEQVADELTRLLDGTVVVGCNPGFDVEFLKAFLSQHSTRPYPAHYRPLDITAVAWGHLVGIGQAEGLRWPLSSEEISLCLGIDPDGYDRHTALGDCRWVRDQWDVII